MVFDASIFSCFYRCYQGSLISFPLFWSAFLSDIAHLWNVELSLLSPSYCIRVYHLFYFWPTLVFFPYTEVFVLCLFLLLSKAPNFAESFNISFDIQYSSMSTNKGPCFSKPLSSCILSAEIQEPIVDWFVTQGMLCSLCSGVSLIAATTRHTFSARYYRPLFNYYGHDWEGGSQVPPPLLAQALPGCCLETIITWLHLCA